MVHVQKKLPESDNIFNIEGILLTSEPMWRHTTFAVGGPADYYAVPSGEEDLKTLLLSAARSRIKIFMLGGGSNLLVSDAGIRGLVIDTHRLDEYHIDDGLLVLGAGLPVSDAVWRAGSAGLAGLEFLFGMPGTVGGALWMNARCYDSEVADLLEWMDVMDQDGHVRRIEADRKEWAYKRSPLQQGGLIALRAAFRVTQGDKNTLRSSMREKRNDREEKGHYRFPCAGSAFKNNRSFGAPSGVLIDRCGLKGFRIGGASVSSWHGNIIINDRGAEASDIRRLLEEIVGKVEKETGYKMEREVLFVGEW